MSEYKIEFKKSAVKELKKLHPADAQKILSKIKDLSTDPRPFGSIKLTNEERYRIRTGDYRVLYEIIDEVLIINVVKIRHRREVYKNH